MSDNPKVHQSIQDYFSLRLLFFYHLSPEEREETFEIEKEILKGLTLSFLVSIKPQCKKKYNCI